MDHIKPKLHGNSVPTDHELNGVRGEIISIIPSALAQRRTRLGMTARLYMAALFLANG